MNALSPNIPLPTAGSGPTQGAATVSASADNTDAALLEAIGAFRAARLVRHEEWTTLTQLPKRHPDLKKRWTAFSAIATQDSRIEKMIARTPALTLAGAVAKAKLGFEMLAGDDPQGDDLLHEEGGHYRMWAVAAQGTRDLLRLLGERCGPDWDESDAELLKVCDRALVAADESDRAGNENGNMLISDPRYQPLHEIACAEWRAFLAHAAHAAKIPATTVNGMRATVFRRGKLTP